MIERGSGRTSGLTDWRLMDVLSMWACLQDQDTTGQWKQVAGWRKVCDLALAHLSRLREYRRGLAEAWPPETNAAARAYLGELDQLIDQVQRTHDAAAANYDALAAATRAIGSTRAELQPLYDEYAEKVRQKRAYEAILADPKAVAGSRLPEKPPVTDGDLEQLNARARGLMTGLSGELQQAQVMLRQPPPRPNIRRQPDESTPSDHLGAVPVIPPIVPVPTASRTSPAHSQDHPRKPVSVTAPPTTPPVLGAGPILGGVGSNFAPASPTVGSPSIATPGASGQPVGPAGPIPTNGYRPNSPFAGRAPNSTPGPPHPINTPASGGAGALPHSTPRPLPPGGLIGGTPSANQPGSKGASRRVNPIGGVIGGGAAGTAPSGAAGSRPGSGRGSQFGVHSGLSPFGGAPGSSSPAGLHGFSGNGNRKPPPDQKSRSWDPDNPWEVDEGVSPVVRPPDEDGPTDPGPAIGLDR
ncbi:hypothetical protein GCM10010169_02330 [Micromonospora fulviviridis]|nr:hypothetical protein GCM10010169_02330 [Micromonospora fulviviridis]